MRKTLSWLILGAAAFPSIAAAATCEESYIKKGNVLTTQKISAEVTVDDVSPQIALNQLRGIAINTGYDVVVDEAASGSMLLEKPKSFGVATLQLLVTSKAIGRASIIHIDTKLGATTITKKNETRDQICSLLNRIQGGRAGVAAAKTGNTAVSSAPPRVVDAVLLTQEISEEGEANEAAVNERYRGKTITIKGRFSRIYTIRDTLYVYYDVPRSTNDLVFKPRNFHFLAQISCVMAPGQKAFALTLKPGSAIRLTGTFKSYKHLAHSLTYENCRPA
jgi:hypothetical protein